ncbi:MAG: leucine-rich repeat domain-containing protein [Mariniblastus sp.]
MLQSYSILLYAPYCRQNENKENEFKLFTLESLSLEGNQLTTLQGLEELENLRQLYLTGNRLNSVAALFFLTQLEVIDLGWNPTLPAEQVYKLRSSLPNCKIKWTDPAGVKSAASGHQ